MGVLKLRDFIPEPSWHAREALHFVERIAHQDPVIVQGGDGEGRKVYGCKWCGFSAENRYSKSAPIRHRSDCLWIAANHILAEDKQHERYLDWLTTL